MKPKHVPEKIIKDVISKILEREPQTERQFLKYNRKASGTYKIPPIPKRQLLPVYHKMVKEEEIQVSTTFEKMLKARAIRTLSGVAPITVLTKAYPCPGNCVYCPTEPNMPKSYLSNEPAVMRAINNQFDPYKQVFNRLRSYIVNGHEPEKIELLTLGGTWSAYPWDYQQWFIKRCFEAANYFEYKYHGKSIPKTKRSYSLKQAQKINEKAKYRIIGITLETRPDWIDDQEVWRLRKLGCTRVQVGAQSLDNEILELTKRGHTIEDLAEATKKLKDNGFKIDYHLMQNLPGSTLSKDIKSVKQTFKDQRFKPDQIKIYPTVVNKYAELFDWYTSGKYKPYKQEKLIDLLIELKKLIPYYCRINRLIRDIPQESIIAGNKVTNLREMLQRKMKEQQITCKCIRCREVRKEPPNITPKLFIEKYQASDGIEYFLSFESPKRDAIFAFLRLRIPGENPQALFKELKNSALIRELHTYGILTSIQNKEKNNEAVQHKGLGTKLMIEAEKIAKKCKYKKIAVISGIGVREFYRKKLGYKQEGTYMTKTI